MSGDKDRTRELESAAGELTQQMGFGRIIGQSAPVQGAINTARRYMRVDSPVLILGESGTGKEIFASSIHYCGPRSDGAFVPVNCSAVPAELFENEFFGHARGAFTGAITEHPGLFEQADGGTIFLDEINSLPLQCQAKLLRAVQQREIRRLGDTAARRFDVRIISASNRELKEEVRAGRFREDLYYRLALLELKLPALREHKDDVPLLAIHCLLGHIARLNCQGTTASPQPSRPSGALRCPADCELPTTFTPAALKKMSDYHWPGNVRELENVIERALILCTGPAIDARDLQFEVEQPELKSESLLAQKKQANYKFEHERLVDLLTRYQGDYALAAKGCQTERRTFYQLARKHGLTGH